MKPQAIVSHVTALFVFIQMVGGAYWLIFQQQVGHFETGIVTIVLSFIAFVLSAISKPRYMTYTASTLLTFIFVLLSGIFSQKDGGMFIHYIFGLIAFGLSLSTTFYATKWSRMAESTQAKSSG